MQAFDLSQLLTNIDGTPIKDTTIGKVLATHLSQSQAKGVDAIRYWDWALNLAKDLPIHISEADYDTLKRFVNESETMTVLAKAQILKRLGTEYPKEQPCPKE